MWVTQGLQIQPPGLILNCGNPPHLSSLPSPPAQRRAKSYNETTGREAETKEGQGGSWSSSSHTQGSTGIFKRNTEGKRERKEGIKEQEEGPLWQRLHKAQSIDMGTPGAFSSAHKKRAALFYGQPRYHLPFLIFCHVQECFVNYKPRST